MNKQLRFFEAEKNEVGIKEIPEFHYEQINKILNQFESDITTPEMIGGAEDKKDVRTNKSLNDLMNWLSLGFIKTTEAVKAGENLLPLIKNGTYSNLTNEVYKLRNETDPIKIENEIVRLANKYTSKIQRPTKKEVEPIEPKIIISETFINE